MTGKRIGYIRVSGIEQNTSRQLNDIQLDRIFKDQASGKNRDRPELTAMLQFAREGDVVFVHSMDRLARNLDDLRTLVRSLTQQGVRLVFVKENLTFSSEDSPMSQLMLSIMGAFAEFERSLLLERQREGIALAKARGAYKGRKRKFSTEEVKALKGRVESGETKAQIARDLGISRETLYRYLRNTYASQ